MTKSTQLLQIAELGIQLIRQKAKIVEKIKNEDTQKLIDDMIATVVEVNGVGIAAPQVYQPLQLFILASYPSQRYPKAPKMKPTAVINPVILSTSETKNSNWEGCLSIPGIRSLVPRYDSITVSYYTRDGTKREKTFTDFIARIFQHEYDHLQGEVFLDRLETMKDIITEKEYQRMFRKKR